MALHDLTPQLRTRLRRVERLVGVFLLLTLGLMVTSFVYFLRHTAEERGWFVTKVPYYTYVVDATGIKEGAPVTMLGRKIGQVTQVEQMPMEEWFIKYRYYVFIQLEIVEKQAGYILTDSVVKIGAGDFLGGGRALEVTRGSEGLVTLKQEKGNPPLLLSDNFRYDSSDTNRTYRSLERAKKGFWLPAVESAPLQQHLTDIANSVNAALPGVFAITNQVAAAITNLNGITSQLGATMPKLDAAVGDFRGLMGDVRPLLLNPGAVGELLVPTNLNRELTLTLSNLNPGTGPIAVTLSNLNVRMGDVGVALSNVNLQLSANTNLLSDANQLTRDVGSLAVTLETLFKRHWLFRSAFKTNRPPESTSTPERPTLPPRDLRRF